LRFFESKSGPWAYDNPWAEARDPWVPIKKSEWPNPPMVFVSKNIGPWAGPSPAHSDLWYISFRSWPSSLLRVRVIVVQPRERP